MIGFLLLSGSAHTFQNVSHIYLTKLFSSKTTPHRIAHGQPSLCFKCIIKAGGTNKNYTPYAIRRISSDYTLLPWSANLPDLNHMENLWHDLDRTVRNHLIPLGNLVQVARALTAAWNALDNLDSRRWDGWNSTAEMLPGRHCCRRFLG